MTTRLVCRSAPLPTTEIAEQMGWDVHHEADRRAGVRLHGEIWPADRAVAAEPWDTDNSQCWSEEIFSMLEGER